jgi:predicted membrane protein
MKRRSIFWGGILLGSGVLLVLYALGLGTQFALVPLIGSLLLLAVSISSFAELNFVFGLLPLPIIAYLWRDRLGIAGMNLWLLLLAAFLLGIGLSSIFWRFKKNRYQDSWHHGHYGHHGRYGRHGDWSSSSTTTSEDENEVVVVDSTFGEQIKYVRSTNLKKVQISSNFSSVKVYFDGCTVSPEGLTIMVDCNFSGIVLYIPRTWNIDNQTRSAFGSVDGAILSSGDYTQVTLAGDVHFGGVKINYL